MMQPRNRQVTVIRDSVFSMPELWCDVYVAGDRYEQQNFAELFSRARCSRVELPEDADFVVFTGGADVNPEFYGEEPHESTSFDIQRDTADLELYDFCLKRGIPMLGICRGAQFLHVMNGGKLYQDVDGHNGDHSMYDLFAKKMIEKVSSVHHQMCIPGNDGMEVVATNSTKALRRWKNPTEWVSGHTPDVEAFFYRSTCCFGIQGHPEYRGYAAFAKWTIEKIEQFFVENPDIMLVDRVRRLKPDLVKEYESTMKLASTMVITEETK